MAGEHTLADAHHDSHLQPPTNVPTKYQLPTPYSFQDIAKTRFYRSKSLQKGQIKVIPRCTAIFIYLFGILRRFQDCTGHITTGSWKDRGNQYIQFVRVLYCKQPTNGKQLPAFPLEAVLGIEPQPQRWEAGVLPLYHRGP